MCVYYIEQLVRHAQPELKEKKVKRKLLQHLHPLTKVLADLEVDLRTNTDEELVASCDPITSHDLFIVGYQHLSHLQITVILH